jgi:GNAT superfamily N-acetyltransferase
VQLLKSNLNSIKNHRKDYFDSLPEFQELYIELMVPDSEIYAITIDSMLSGYVIVSATGVLIEFYLIEQFIPFAHKILIEAIKELDVTHIYCKTFDFLLLGNCLRSGFSYTIEGMLYRHYNRPLVAKDNSLSMIQSGRGSVPLLTGQDNSIRELFETEQQLLNFIETELVFEFYRENTLVGCGMIIKTHSDYDFCDLGVWVHPSHRGKKIGSNILISLREFALKQDFTPSCGCGIDNVSSQKAIEKCGFISKFQLLDFNVEGAKGSNGLIV